MPGTRSAGAQIRIRLRWRQERRRAGSALCELGSVRLRARRDLGNVTSKHLPVACRPSPSTMAPREYLTSDSGRRVPRGDDDGSWPRPAFRHDAIAFVAARKAARSARPSRARYVVANLVRALAELSDAGGAQSAPADSVDPAAALRREGDRPSPSYSTRARRVPGTLPAHP